MTASPGRVRHGFTLPASLAAPRLSAKAGLTKAAKTDPQVKALFDKVASMSKTAMLQKALLKTKALKAIRSNTINNPVLSCGSSTVGRGGTMTINGSNNYDSTATDGYDELSYTITFNACNDGVSGTETNGSLSLHGKTYADLSSITSSITMKNLTVYDLTYLDTVTVNASMGWNVSMPDSDHFSETVTANGYFADSVAAGAESSGSRSAVSSKHSRK